MKRRGGNVIKPAAQLEKIGKELEAAFKNLHATRNEVRRIGAQLRKTIDRIEDKDTRYKLETLLRRLAIALDGVFLEDQINWQ
jgi:DNA anti-recombination protein RmuC